MSARRLFVLFLFLPWLVGFGPVSLVESDAARAPVTEATLGRLAARRPPVVQARAVIVVDATTGGALWEREADARLPMASTTKVMTALVAVERTRLDTPVPVRLGASELPGLSNAGLRAGDQLPLGEMLYGLLLPSGGDAAVAIAGAVGGSTDAFVALMNRRAAELGLQNTHFANPHGDDAPGQYASARDLARLSRIALDVPALAEIVTTKQHSARGKFVYNWTNSNRLLFLRPDVTGVKTGTTDAAGDVLIASARQGDRRAIAVVMHSPDRWDESSALLDYFFKQFALVRPELPPSPFYRGLTVRSTAAETVPVWQVGLLATELQLTDGGARVSWELAGRPFGESATLGP